MICMDRTTQICKAFANEERLRIILRLSRAQSVTQLHEGCTLTQSALSQHLKVLRDAHVVIGQRTGKEVIYRLHDRRALALAKAFLHYSHSSL